MAEEKRTLEKTVCPKANLFYPARIDLVLRDFGKHCMCMAEKFRPFYFSFSSNKNRDTINITKGVPIT